MRKKLLLYVGLIMSVASTLGQELPKLKVTEREMDPTLVFRRAGDNETVVEVQSNVLVTFESTMDKAVNVYEMEQKNGFYYFKLLFPTGREYTGRKLKIYSHGFDSYIQPLELKAKMPVRLLVINETKRIADELYNEEKYREALKEYEKLYSINSNDEFVKDRISSCNNRIDPNRRVGTYTEQTVSFVFKSTNKKLSAKLYIDNQLIGETNFNKGFQLRYLDINPGPHKLRIVWNDYIRTWEGVINTDKQTEFIFEYKRMDFGYQLEQVE